MGCVWKREQKRGFWVFLGVFKGELGFLRVKTRFGKGGNSVFRIGISRKSVKKHEKIWWSEIGAGIFVVSRNRGFPRGKMGVKLGSSLEQKWVPVMGISLKSVKKHEKMGWSGIGAGIFVVSRNRGFRGKKGCFLGGCQFGAKGVVLKGNFRKRAKNVEKSGVLVKNPCFWGFLMGDLKNLYKKFKKPQFF